LNDLLTSTLNYPNIVFNEGIGGESSGEAVARIDSILERHPESNKVLILLGTNDSGNGVSASTYRSRMQSLVNLVVASGKEAWVALVLPVFNLDGTPNTSRNNIIQSYNDVILYDLNSITVGPDFYSFFIDKYYTHYANYIHPNGVGYAAMAEEWHDVLTNQ
jgi:lysophospholipase L1-like esterase